METSSGCASRRATRGAGAPTVEPRRPRVAGRAHESSPRVLDMDRTFPRRTAPDLRALPGPPSASWLYGNLEEMHEQENNSLVARWTARYGPAFVYRGFLSGPRLMTTDPVAIAHILGHADDYPKPDFVRDTLAAMTAGRDGLLVVEGDAHRRQVRIYLLSQPLAA